MKTEPRTFKLDRETKNTYRFQEEARIPVIGTLYVQKHAFGNGEPPSSITVTIEAK